MSKQELLIQLMIEDKMTLELAPYEEKLAAYDEDERDMEEFLLINKAVKQKFESMSGEEIKQLVLISINKVAVCDGLDELIKRVIEEFPYSLLHFQALQNDFKMLVDLISDQVGVAMSVEDIAHMIADAFNFVYDEAFTVEECMGPAEKIYQHIHTI